MKQSTYNFGMVGLGVMGRNLLLNMADHGVKVAGYDKDSEKVKQLSAEANTDNVKAFTSVKEFVDSLSKPRAVMMLVPAGKIVDSVIEEFIPLLDKGDLLIDGGNSYFADTERRVGYLESKGLHFFGMGVSGGEEGARNGPSMMPGGNKEAYEVVRNIFESIAAKVNGTPCVTYIGRGAAGHFVKMVHNGIEYAIMQLIAEVYQLMHNGLKLSSGEIHKTFAQWNEGKLKSFLIETTRDILAYKEPGTDKLLLEFIKDEARSKGTGKWTSQVAMDLQIPITAIDTSVAMRDISKYKAIRQKASALYKQDTPSIKIEKDKFLKSLEDALFFATSVAYGQGLHLLTQASKEYHYGLQIDQIALIWRGGCIIRSAFLEDIYQSYKQQPGLEHLFLNEEFANKIKPSVAGMREVVIASIQAGISSPGLSSALAYFDTLRNDKLPTNMIQAQRDFFGAHTYERIDKEGVFHTNWHAK